MNYKENDDSISLDELDKRLFDCADVLRGSIDSGRYKDFVLPLVFYAAINGWQERELDKKVQQKESKNYDELDDEGKKQFFRTQVQKEFGIYIPEEYTWDELVEENENVAAKIDKYFTEFEELNQQKNTEDGRNRFSNVFNNEFTAIDSFSDEDGSQLLKEVLSKIDSIDFSRIPPDLMGEAYMNLVKRFSEADSGEYFTPPNIVDLVVRMLEPFEEGSTFHDPTVGSGGMLVEAAQHIREQYQDEFEDDKNYENIENNAKSADEKLRTLLESQFRFTGQEKNPTITGIGKMNLALHGLTGDIRRGDSLTNPQFTDGNKLEKFDYILANFPFSQSGWKSDTSKRQDTYGDLDWADNGKLPHGNYGDFAFIMHMDSHLADDGQLATIIPHGILFRNGDQKYREYMIEQDMVEAVIGLPEELFEATGIPSAILVINKDKPEDREGEVMFFNADHEDRFFYDTGSSRNVLLDDGISEIKEKFDNWSDEERVCRTVSVDEIEENEYNMNIALYVDTTEPQEDISVSDTLSQVRELEQEYDQLNKQFTTYMRQLEYETTNDGDTDDS